MTPLDQVQALYARTHGVPLREIVADPLPADRVAFWSDFWRDLRFDTAAPVGSSRLMEIAVVQALVGGTAHEMLQALVDVAVAPVDRALDHFLMCLYAGMRALGVDPRVDLALPESPAPAQAAIVLRFAPDPRGWPAAKRLAVLGALEGAPVPGVVGSIRDELCGGG